MPDTSPGADDDTVQLLAELFYSDLQRLAHSTLRRASTAGMETLQTTALVHEAYLKLARQGGFRDRNHFLAMAALAMRHVLVSNARRRLAEKRGGGQAAVQWEAVEAMLGSSGDRIVALDDALQELEQHHPRLARVVECRYFAGYSEAETAAALGVVERTVQRDWAKARALLYDALGKG